MVIGVSSDLKSGPTEDTIECRRYKRGDSTRGVSFHPLVWGWGSGFGVHLPPTNVCILNASMFIFNVFFFMFLGLYFSGFGDDIYLKKIFLGE